MLSVLEMYVNDPFRPHAKLNLTLFSDKLVNFGSYNPILAFSIERSNFFTHLLVMCNVCIGV